MEFKWENINTFKDIFNIVLSIKDIAQFKQLLELKSDGKDILETIIRLFAYTECLAKNSSEFKWKACSGNFNLGTIKRENNMFNLFYEIKNNKISLKKIKDSGDSSDLTIMNENGDIIAFTSKNLSKKNMKFNNMDIDKLLMYSNEYKVKVKLGVCCRYESEWLDMINKCKNTTLTPAIKKIISKTIVIDKHKLTICWERFKQKYSNTNFEDLVSGNVDIERSTICFRPHQEYTIHKTLHIIRKYQSNKQYVNILWGHVARSGKSYMMLGVIEEIFKTGIEKGRTNLNICIITTAPNETIQQYLEIMKSLISKDFGFVNIITDLKQVQSNYQPGFNLFILSKQLLAHKENKDIAVKLFNSKEKKISLLIGDEIHHGGSTIISKDLINKCFKKCSKIFVTATYNKVKYNFDIHETINWSLENIQTMKKNNSDLRLVYEDAEEFVISKQYYSSDYNLYPKLSVIGVDKFDHVLQHGMKSIFNNIKDNRNELKQMMNYVLHYIIFKLNEENIKINQRSILGNNFNKVPVIIIFLPSLNISKTSKILSEIILELNQTAEVCLCNTSDSNDSFKENILNSQKIAINLGRSYVVALTGSQGHLGVSIEDCDLVILMNDSNSLDFIFQSMFRSMTESRIGNKQVGYVIDFNLKRSIFSMLEYSNSNKDITNYSDIKALENIIKNDVIDFRFSTGMEMNLVDRQYMFNKIQDYYNSIKMSRIDYYINKINNIDLELVNIISKDMLLKIKKLSTNIQIDENKKNKDLVFKDNESDNKSNIINSSSEKSDSTASEIKANDITYFISSIKYLTPLCCILTLDECGKSKLNLIDMLIYIQRDSSNLELKSVLTEQFSTWCGKKVSTMDVDNLIQTIEELSLENSSFKKQVEDVSSTIKLILMEAKGDMKEMSKLVEKHLTPSVLEKKKNAEVSTPDKLCKEMLSSLKKEIKVLFKESNGLINRPFKIFEPCCGKGIFLINIYLFLKENSTLSDKQILEECIYFADISPLNIFICRLLLNQIVDENGEEYKLNYSLGNTLELDIKSKWGLEGFDAVVGNPPYNEDSYRTLDNYQKPLYHLWVYKFVDNSLYIIYVTPSKWFSSEVEELREFRKNMGSYNVSILNSIPDDTFKNVSIKGGCSYFMIDKYYKGLTNFNNTFININKYDIIVDSKFYSVLDKIIEFVKDNDCLSKIYNSQGTYLNNKNEKLLCKNYKENNIKCLVSKAKGLYNYINDDLVKKEYNYYKLATPAAAFSGKSGFSNLYILNDLEIHSRSYIHFKCESFIHAKYLKSYLECKTINLMLYLRKISHNMCHKDLFKWIPLITLDKEYLDSDLYKIFNLTSEEIAVIESANIKML